jgi:hypothetical protein
LAQVSLGSSFLATNVLVLRILLSTGFLCLTIWSAAVLDISVDSTGNNAYQHHPYIQCVCICKPLHSLLCVCMYIVFSGVYFLLNAFQAARLIYNMRPIKFDQARETIYQHYFGDNKLIFSRLNFKTMTDNCEIVTVKQGALYAKRFEKCDNVSFLLSGQLSFRRYHDSDNSNSGNSHSERDERFVHLHGNFSMFEMNEAYITLFTVCRNVCVCDFTYVYSRYGTVWYNEWPTMVMS